jgi:hypothetical protein
MRESNRIAQLNKFLNEAELSDKQKAAMDVDDDNDIDGEDLSKLRKESKDDDDEDIEWDDIKNGYDELKKLVGDLGHAISSKSEKKVVKVMVGIREVMNEMDGGMY